MTPEALAFIGTSDLAGLLRGKSIPHAALAGRMGHGVGITHSNLMMSPFGPILDTPFGTAGDLMLVPDASTEFAVPALAGPDLQVLLGDFRTTDNHPWDCCPRTFLRNALEALEAEFGLILLATFEQELTYTGVDERPGAPYRLDTLRRQGAFGGLLIAAMRAAGIEPDSFLAESGPRQYEVTAGPAVGLRAADEAVMVRELARAVAGQLGHRAILAPMITADGVGSGTHVHWSLRDSTGTPVTYDADGTHGLSAFAEHFTTGILLHLPALVAVTAPSVPSYYRLRPGRWAPTAVDLGVQDRGSAVRICPVYATAEAAIARQFNVEFRVADAAASPYLTLGVLVWAGIEGLRGKLLLSELQPATLPTSLEDAIARFVIDPAISRWFGPVFHDVYVRFKRAEVKALAGLDEAEICRRYADIY
jgi:glutamine synthetase